MKKIILLLAVCLLAGMVTVSATTITKEHWAEKYISSILSRKNIDGDIDSLLVRPDDFITKAELCEALVKTLGLKSTEEGKYFGDTKDHWARDYIRTAVEFNLIESNEGQFSPDSFITRESAVVIMSNAITQNANALIGYRDSLKVSGYAKKSIGKMSSLNLLNGYPDGNIRPDQYMTRAEAFKIIDLMDKWAIDKTQSSAAGAEEGKADLPLPTANSAAIIQTGSAEMVTPQVNDIAQGLQQSPVTESEQATPYTDETGTAPADDPQVAGTSPMAGFSLLNLPADNVAAQKYPRLAISAEMGSCFSTVDVTIWAQIRQNSSTVFYLAKERGSRPPTAEEILAYNDGSAVDGLTTGKSVRGNFNLSQNDVKIKLTLSGSENIRRLPGETGFIDGYNYDIYMITRDNTSKAEASQNDKNALSAGTNAVTEYGQISDVAVYTNVMAMPFDAKSKDGKTFTIRSLTKAEINRFQHLQGDFGKNSRQLVNIQRLADLYKETEGIHGSEEFLTSGIYTYVLDSDMDLTSNMSDNDETGWTPIGNSDADRSHAFQGSFEGKNHTIRNLYIHRDAQQDGENNWFQGLFGRAENATIRNLNIESPDIYVTGNMTTSGDLYVGALIGSTKNCVLYGITVTNPKITAYAENSMCSVGGVIGCAENTDISSTTASNVSILSYDSSSVKNASEAVGGIVGKYTNTYKAIMLFNDITVSGRINAVKTAGGAIGSIEFSPGFKSALYADGIETSIYIPESEIVGGVVGTIGKRMNIPQQSKITFADVTASGSVTGKRISGGLFGVVNAEGRNVILKDSISYMTVTQSDDAVTDYITGAFIGSARNGSVENCYADSYAMDFCGEYDGTEFINCFSEE